jgi:polysaccharide biosynthesis/export protein
MWGDWRIRVRNVFVGGMFVTRKERSLPTQLLQLFVCAFFLTAPSVCRAAQSATPPASSSGQDKSGKAAAKTGDAAGDPDVDATTYRIGVEDDLLISVWKEPELSQTVTVRPDGKITLPLINEVLVLGLKTSELQDLLTEKLKPFVNEPQVTVVVRTIRSRKVYIVGKANRQGAFPLNGRTTMLQLLAEAGGLTPFAKGGSIHIVRKEGGKEVHIPFNYKKALAGQADDPVLVPGDMIIIP